MYIISNTFHISHLNLASVSSHSKIMMSHKKVHSQGNVPFMWEASPGVSKGVLPQTKMNPSQHFSNNPRNSAPEGKLMKIPPPPCPGRPPRRTCSRKSLKGMEDDPFLVALKECTKGAGNTKGADSTTAVMSILGFTVRKGKFNFSCRRGSCDVEDGNLVKLHNLPRIPRMRSVRITE